MKATAMNPCNNQIFHFFSIYKILISPAKILYHNFEIYLYQYTIIMKKYQVHPQFTQ